jgi:hypothetical protein
LFAVGGQFGAILTSEDGNQWSFQTSGTDNGIASLAYGNGTFVALAPRKDIYSLDVTLTSTNGFDWIPNTPAVHLPGSTLCYGHGTFLAAGGDGWIVTSTNGVDWIRREVGTRNSFRAAAYGKRTFVVGGDFGSLLQSSQMPPGEVLLGPVTPLPEGTYSITAAGTPGENWQIQGSSNLMDWTPLADIFNPDPVFEFIDTPGEGVDKRFYRALAR